ncbi:hypothetical protein ACPV50_13685 [Vibrio astriarenae]
MKDDGSTINTNNIRECRFYWRGLLENGFRLPPEPQKSQQYCTAINAAFDATNWDTHTRREYVRDMKNASLAQLIPQKELEWLDKEQERMCFWIWCCCRLLASNDSIMLWNNPNLNLSFEQGFNPFPYSALGLSEYPRTAKERHQLIVEFLDKSSMNLDFKRSLLEFWKQHWGETFLTEKFFWVDNKDDEQCAWFANYITNNGDFQIPAWFIPEPTTTQERYDACIAAFDIWPTDTSTKKLFIIKMKKAWSQKKHRLAMKKKNKKSYNFTLSCSAKEMLDEMAEHAEISRNEFLERLIKMEHSRSAL